jgi:hypothetical protein
MSTAWQRLPHVAGCPRPPGRLRLSQATILSPPARPDRAASRSFPSCKMVAGGEEGTGDRLSNWLTVHISMSAAMPVPQSASYGSRLCLCLRWRIVGDYAHHVIVTIRQGHRAPPSQRGKCSGDDKARRAGAQIPAGRGCPPFGGLTSRLPESAALTHRSSGAW